MIGYNCPIQVYQLEVWNMFRKFYFISFSQIRYFINTTQPNTDHPTNLYSLYSLSSIFYQEVSKQQEEQYQ